MSDASADLPLPDYDHLPLETLRQRIRALDADQLTTVLTYEHEHGDRLPVTEALRIRLEQLRAGAEPSGADPAAPAPEAAGGPPDPQVTSPPGESPSITPPRHGAPGNPTGPR